MGSSPLTRGKHVAVGVLRRGDGLIPAHAGKTHLCPASGHGGWAHPRSRGENSDPAYGRALSMGSSPLTRGKQHRVMIHQQVPGLIPAHAGKTQRRPAPCGRNRAHPRSRGENRPPVRLRASWAGSSPLTRGKLDCKVYVDSLDRLIPAHAGKTLCAGRYAGLAGAHPRSRGENISSGRSALPTSGSSPLTRGKLRIDGTDTEDEGLIPAHAGKTTTAPRRLSALWAHPRSRGENVVAVISASGVAGSSPLTRGKRHEGVDRGLDEGLIPAHAGKTPRPDSIFFSAGGSSPLTRGKHGLVFRVGGHPGLIPAHAGKTPDRRDGHGGRRAHPRSRGENPQYRSVPGTLAGSSPLTRGKLGRDNEVADRLGLIPAHAGKTSPERESYGWFRAHPRSRGENATREYASACQLGSSPLTRGKRSGNGCNGRRRGLIPAHAGKTPPRGPTESLTPAHPRSRGENSLIFW